MAEVELIVDDVLRPGTVVKNRENGVTGTVVQVFAAGKNSLTYATEHGNLMVRVAHDDITELFPIKDLRVVDDSATSLIETIGAVHPKVEDAGWVAEELNLHDKAEKLFRFADGMLGRN